MPSYSVENVTNCINYANITGSSMVAGICAYYGEGANFISNCENHGTITITGAWRQGDGAAGILSSCGDGSVIENCINYGDLELKRVGSDFLFQIVEVF